MFAEGAQVKIHPRHEAQLTPPFNHYARLGRNGTVIARTKEGAWRVSFQSPNPNARPRTIVLWDRELLPAR